MKILGIETSCDETAVAIVEHGTKILGSAIASSIEIHKKSGGIIPENAAREQIVSIIPIIKETLKKAGLKSEDIDALAVTYGPGLIGSLLVGVETAKTLAFVWKKPLVPVNHLVAHLYANWLDKDESNLPSFPALGLVVSGGHTDLVNIKDHGKLEWIAATRDDAAGEAFDKTARLLGLPYPGGPEISKLADKFFKESQIKNYKLDMFPRPLSGKNTLDWSFSGLKTAVLRKVETDPTSSKLNKAELAAQIQEAIVDSLVEKTTSAVEHYKPKSLLVSGGVAANKRLREKLQKSVKDKQIAIDLFIPDPKYCTDNGAVIAACAYFNNHAVSWKKVEANPELNIVSK